MTDAKPEEKLSPPQQTQKDVIAGMEAHLPQLQRLQNRQRRIAGYREKIIHQMKEISEGINPKDIASILTGMQKSDELQKRDAKLTALMDRLTVAFNAQMNACLETQRSGIDTYQRAQIEHDVCYGGVQNEVIAKPLPAIKRRNSELKK